MALQLGSSLPRAARTCTATSSPVQQLCMSLGLLGLSHTRPFHHSTRRRAPTTPVSTQSAEKSELTPVQRAERAAARAREKIKQTQTDANQQIQLGGLAPGSVFADETSSATATEDADPTRDLALLSKRSYQQMSPVLNPRPNARSRWHRKMLIRHIRRSGRLTRPVKIARTEREHLSKSHFFKTSMKKLMMLSRQIAGKSIDEAILQMRFSHKKVAQDVHRHLVQARNEAIVIRGMGIDADTPNDPTLKLGPIELDPSITPPTSIQTPTKTLKSGIEKKPTDIYIAQSWINRGPYGQEPEFRARGRVNMLRPPHTGMTVLLKEEKTRTREQVDKEAKALRKRLGKNMWTQLPDRPITNQSQYVLW